MSNTFLPSNTFPSILFLLLSLLQLAGSTFDIPPAFFHRRGEPFNYQDFQNHQLYAEGCYTFNALSNTANAPNKQWCFTRTHPNAISNPNKEAKLPKNNIFDFLTSRHSFQDRIKIHIDQAFQRYSKNIILDYDYISIGGSATHIGSSDDPSSRGSAYLQTTVGLIHSAEQLEYLVEQNKLPAAFLAIAQSYRDTISQKLSASASAFSLSFRGTTFFPVTLEDLVAQFFTFNSLIYYPKPMPLPLPGELGLMKSVLNPTINWSRIEEKYLNGEIIIVDNVLQDWALEAAYQFCLEATIFYEQKVGYLGAYDVDGLYAGIFPRITKELRVAMPLVVGDTRLDKFWAYKYIGVNANVENQKQKQEQYEKQRGTIKHTDKASVNMNMWVTPDSANLDPLTGGMSIWDYRVDTKEAFEKFQDQSADGNAETILLEMLKAAGSQRTNVPHKRNRMVIFDSSLVHETDTLKFRSGHKNRRINLTWLWGDPVWVQDIA